MKNLTEPALCIVPPDMRLYQIDERIRSLIDPETGEVADDKALSELQIERKEALEGIALLCREKKAVIATAKEEKKRLDAIAGRAEYQLERLLLLLDEQLGDDSSFSTGKVSVSTRRVSHIEVNDDEKALDWVRKNPEVWQGNLDSPIRVKTEITLVKKGLAEILRTRNIPGVSEVYRRAVMVK